jgi:hypothetical protein
VKNANQDKITGENVQKETATDTKVPTATDSKVPVDFAEVRRNLATQVGTSAAGIVNGLIEVAKAGQVAPAKYLFELVGLYPATAETMSPEDSPVYAFLKRVGLTTASSTGEKDSPLAASAAELAAPGANGIGENREEEDQRDGKPEEGNGGILRLLPRGEGGEDAVE